MTVLATLILGAALWSGLTLRAWRRRGRTRALSNRYADVQAQLRLARRQRDSLAVQTAHLGARVRRLERESAGYRQLAMFQLERNAELSTRPAVLYAGARRVDHLEQLELDGLDRELRELEAGT